MGNNVNTIPLTNEDMGYSFRIVSLESIQHTLDIKIPDNAKEGRLPKKVSKSEPTYIIVENDVWNRCVKVDSKKLRKLKGAEVTDEAKKKRLQEKLARKYYQEKNSNDLYNR